MPAPTEPHVSGPTATGRSMADPQRVATRTSRPSATTAAGVAVADRRAAT